MHTRFRKSIILLIIILLLAAGYTLYINNSFLKNVFAHAVPTPTITAPFDLSSEIEFYRDQLKTVDDPEALKVYERNLRIAEDMATMLAEGAKVTLTRPFDPYVFARTPIPTTAKITGIFEPINVFPAGTFKIKNGWQEKVNGNYIAVISGAFTKEPMQGILHIRVNEDDDHFYLDFEMPEKHGPVEIKSAKNYRLLLEAEDGWTIYFDVPSMSFTQSEDEVLPTRTPGPPQPVIIETKSAPYP